MAVDTQRDVVDAGHVLFQVAKQLVEFGRDRIADRVGYVDGRCACLDCGGDDFGQVGKFGPRCVFG